MQRVEGAPLLLVTGASGCVGRAVVAAAKHAGWTVRGLGRSGPGRDWGGDQFVTGAVEDAAAVTRAAAGAGAVVHLASWVHRVPGGAEEEAALRRAIVDGTGHVAAAAAQNGAPLVAASTIAVYGGDRPMGDEMTPPAPTTLYGVAKLESEAAVTALGDGGTVLRLALVYGPHDRGNFLRLVRAVDRRRALVVGSGSNRKSMVYVENVADRILLCLARRIGGTYVVADDPAPSQRELFTLVARSLGRRPPFAIPLPVARAAARAVDAGLRVAGARTTFADKVMKLATPTEFAGARLDRTLGYAPRISLEEGVRRTVAWYRTAGAS